MSAQTIITRTRTRARTPLALALLALLPASAWAQHAGHAPASSRDAPPAATAPPHHAPAPRSPQQRGATPTPPAGHDRHDGHEGHDGHDTHDGHGAHAGHDRTYHAPGSGGQDRAGSHPQPHGGAPDTPRTPIPAPTEADFAAAFPVLAHHAMEHASPITRMVLFDRLEAWDADHGTGLAWEATAWVGGDIHRLWLRSEGERSGGRTESSDLEVLYGRSITAWWDLVGGVRQDFRPRGRTWGAFGVQGLAPYMFEVSATAYVGSGGQVQLKAEAEYDIRFTNRLILQPLVEATMSSKDEPREGIGSGLGKLETGLRLRYEFSRRFAPYVGLVHERSFGRTADYAEAAGGHARDTRVVAGVRVWF